MRRLCVYASFYVPASQHKMIQGDAPPDYARDHDLIHQRDPKLPVGQEVALVSWIDGDAHTIKIHGCFRDNDDAKEFYEQLCEKSRARGQPILGQAGTFNLGWWMAWPPKLEYFAKNATDKGQHIVDRSLQQHVDRRERARQELMDRVEERTSEDYRKEKQRELLEEK